MKKTLALILSLFLILGICAACSSDNETDSSIASEPVKEESQTVSEKTQSLALNPLTGEHTLDKSAVGKRPVSIMINNIKISLPQRGISSADLYYEVLAEGGITRILAVFPDINKIPDTGSVRSARHYFLELAAPHKAIFMHFGGSPLALQTIKDRGLDTINCLNTPSAFYRDQNRVGKIPYEHTAFTDSTKILAAVKKKNINTDGKSPVAFNFGDNASLMSAGESALNITVPFSSGTKGTFSYNTQSGFYEKGEFSAPQIDGTTGKALEVKNVFILKTSITKLENSDNPSRIDVDLTGGNGYYAVDGKIIPITWKKGDFNSQLKYYTADGSELKVSTGKSWVCIISNTAAPSYN